MKLIRTILATLLSGLTLMTATVPVTAATYKIVVSPQCSANSKCSSPALDLCDILNRIGIRCIKLPVCTDGCKADCDVPTTQAPTVKPTEVVIPTEAPTIPPTEAATIAPTEAPTIAPTEATIATEAPTEAPPTEAPASSLSEYEQEVVALTNRYRAQYGLQPLAANKRLSDIARMKSQDMHDKGYFDHTSPTYGSPFDMMKRFGVNYRSAGENIAMGYRTPEAVVEGWMNSPGHRANILRASFTEIGVGYVPSGNYWTQMFIG